MEYIHIDLPLKAVRLFPIGDWHLGSRQCDKKFIKKVLGIIKEDPIARWVGMGDLLENAIIGSKSDVYLQKDAPEKQLEEVVELLEPIRDKGLFMIPGNHEERTMRVVGLRPNKVMARQLGIPFLSYSALATLDLTEARTPRSFTCYFHHNAGGGYTPGGKVNNAARLRGIVPTADATFSAHMHTTARIPVKWFDAGYKKLIEKRGYDYIIGAALTYKDSYAEEKAARAAPVEQIAVTFVGATTGQRDNRRQIYEIILPD